MNTTQRVHVCRRHSRPFVALSASALLLLLVCQRAGADATAISQISFSGLTISPGAGSFQLLTPWQASAFAQGGVNNQYNSGTSPSAFAAGDFSLGLGSASVPPIPAYNVSGMAGASNAIVGQLDASDQAAGRGTVWEDQFMITGGSGSVNTTFSLQLNEFLSVATDLYGQSAQAEAVLTLQLNGNPVLFSDQLLSIGSNESQSAPLSTVLTDSTTLQYNTVYQLLIEGDAEASVLNTPEPNAGALGIGMLLVFLFWRKRTSLTKMPKGALLIVGAFFFSAVSSFATYIGSDPPQVCEKCGYPPNRQSVGSTLPSLTEGNLSENYPVVSLQSGAGPTLQLSLTYNSYNADGSRAQIDSGIGLGWTHSYNLFLFSQRGSFSLMGPDGRITLFHESVPGTYITDSGYFETLTPLGSGAYAITNKEQSWWIFNSVPNTPFLVAGPVLRLIQMGDRNNNVTSLTYSNGLLTQISDTYGRTLQFGYTNHHLETITDPLGRTTQFQYDSKFRTPIRITDPNGKAVRYSYNSLYQMTRKIDRDNRTYLYLFRNQKPWAALDGNGQTWFSMLNPSNWAVDRYTLAYSLRRVYIPSITTNTDGNGDIWRYQYDTNGYITELIAPDGAVSSYGYDSSTRLLAVVTNADGAVTRYQYDAMGNRTNMTDALGNVTSYTYDPVFNQITSMMDSSGRVTIYEYDGHGNRIAEINPLNETNFWTYDTRGNVTSSTDRNGYTTAYAYDAFGNCTNSTDPLGDPTTYAYDAVGNRVSLTDPLGHTTQYQYDALDRIIGITNALGGVTSYTYDALGRKTSMTDPNTNSTTYQYDVRGRLVQTTDALGNPTTYDYDLNNNRAVLTDALGQVTTYAYDVQNRLVGETNALGGTTAYTYDPVGNQTSTTDPNGNTTTYTYDALNRRITETNALGGATTYSYASPTGPPCCTPSLDSSLITRSEDADGNATFYHYDELDRQVQVVRKNSDTNDVINPTDAVTTTAYDPDGNVVGVTDPNSNTTIYAYDADDRQISIIDAAGDTTLTAYDAGGNVLTATEPNGNVTTNVYDALNRVIAAYDQVGTVSADAYDTDGNVTAAVDGRGDTTIYTYDSLNRQTAVTDALGQTSTTVYDAIGNVITTIDRNGHTTGYTYDPLNRRIDVIDALSHTNITAYDADGNVIGVTDANGHTTTYGYDALNRQVTETYPDSPPNTRTNVYDAVGNLIERIDQKGQITAYSYNDLYYLTNRAYSPSGSNDSFTYDDGGRMLSANRGGWVDSFAYDRIDRLTNSLENGRTQTYAYNIPGRVQTNTYPSGRTIISTYDARERLVSENDGTPNPPIALYSYDAADRVMTRTYRNGAIATYGYNSNDWVISLEHSNSVGRIAGFDYAYDNEGNKLDEAMLDRSAISQAYSYDALNRITNFSIGTLSGTIIPTPAEQEGWTLDPVDNWLKESTNGVTEQTDVEAADNELTSINGTSLAYDANGNVTQDAGYNYAYDEENRLTQVVRRSDSAVVGEYVYDALGRRVKKVADPNHILSTNVYFYDESRIVEEQDAGGATQATYTYGNYQDEVLTMDRPGSVYYYHQDALWDPNALSDANGNVAERYTYDAYGDVAVLDTNYNVQPPNSWGTPHSLVDNPFLFTGREFDEETGIYNYRARYYDSAEGRFLQRDPSEKETGENLYAYTADNPVNQTDPSGRDELKLSVIPMGRTTGNCGEYSWRAAWRLSQPTKHEKGGWVVQHIQAEIKAEDAKGNALDKPASSSLEYWEAWYISSNGISPWRPYDKLWDDKYWATGRGGGTKGTISVKGTAAFYEGLELPKPPFKKKEGNKGAGNLWVSDVDPKLEGGTAKVNHNLEAKWDCIPCVVGKVWGPVPVPPGIPGAFQPGWVPVQRIPDPKTKITSTEPAK